MRFLSFVIAVASLVASTAIASPTNPRNGQEFTTLAPAQPVQAAGKKIEVIEFFMYHCPACNSLEPALAEWVKKQGDNINFRRVHIPHSAVNDPEAHLFLTLEAMGTENAMHDKVLHVWHVEHRRLMDDAANIEWATKNGIDKTKFLDYYNSFGVTTKLRGLGRVTESYKVEGTPTLVIDGRYLTSPSMVGAANAGMPNQTVYAATLQVADALIAKAVKDGGSAGNATSR